MRVCLVADGLDGSRGGAESYLRAFIRAARKERHEVCAVLRRPPPEPDPELAEVEIHVCAPTAATRGGALRAFAREAPRAAANLWPDVTIATAGGGEETVDVWWPHGGVHRAMREATGARHGAIRRFLRKLAPGERTLRRLDRARFDPDAARRWVAVSSRVADDMVRAGAPADRVRVVRNGVDVSRYRAGPHPGAPRLEIRRRLGLPERGVLCLHVAHHFEIKGLPTLLEALARTDGAARAINLAIIGGGDRASVRREVRRLGLTDRVRLVGPVPEVAPYYRAADIVCQPTWYDPCSLVTLEAAAAGRAVVTTRRDGASEVVGEDGLVVLEDPGDPAACREALERLAREPDRRKTLGRHARRAAEKRPLWKAVDEMLEVAREAAAGERPVATEGGSGS